MRRPTVLTMAVASAMLASCANPVLNIGGPGFSVTDSPPVSQEPDSMGDSLVKLNHLRAQYYGAIRQQREASLIATDGLTWLGAALVGMAYAKAAHGWIVGTALVGGTTYGLTHSQLDARQVELWQQGIEALDCARRASLPLDIGQAQQKAILQAMEQLVAARDQVQAGVVNVNNEVVRLGRANVPKLDLVDQAVNGATAAAADADTAMAAAHALLNAARGRELSGAVDRVGAQVLRATGDIAVDVSSVKSQISGIASLAAIFVPGIDGTLNQSMAQLTAPSSSSTSMRAEALIMAANNGVAPVNVDALTSALQQLSQDMLVLSARQTGVKALVSSVDTAAISEAMRSCGISGVSTAIVLQPSTLQFTEKKADGKGVAIAGGTPPYEVSLLDPVAGDAVSVTLGQASDRLLVKVGASANPGTYTVAVKDSSTAHRVTSLPVVISAAAAPASAPATLQKAVKKATVQVKAVAKGASAAAAAGSAAGPGMASASATTQALWATLAAKLPAAPPFVVTGGASVSVASAKAVNGTLVISLACTQPIDSSLATQLAIKAALIRVDPETVAQLRQAGAIDAASSQIKLYRLDACVKVQP